MITKDNNLKVMEFFFKYPNRTFHIRELARLTKLSSSGIIKIIRKLKDENLLVSKKTKIIEEIKPNLGGDFLFLKRLYNLYSLSDSGLINYLKEFYELPKAIILFGSYSLGTDIEKSDIDIAIITIDKKYPDLEKFENRLVRKINLHLIDINKATKEFKNSLANGIILEGFVELVK